MKKILFSLATIGVVSALTFGATTAFFSDTETSAGNTFTAGTIDISVDGENPWTTSWHNYLDKPSQTNYLVFRVQNTGENPADVYKKITEVVNAGGLNVYPTSTPPLASSEPEYEAGNGQFDLAGNPTGVGYTKRDNLSAFMVYDMSVCKVGVLNGENSAPCECLTADTDGNGNGAPIPEGQCWEVLIDGADQVRIDNVTDVWKLIAENLLPTEQVVVAQSYHLMNWDDSGEPLVMNWAQGDTMTFDIVLDARQIDAEAPGVMTNNTGAPTATVTLAQKDAEWNIVAGASGTLTYAIEGPTFDFDFSATGLVASANYCLIYYADPWPGTGGQDIKCDLSDGSGNINWSGNPDTGTIPVPADANAAVGGKVWLVPAADYNQGTNEMIAWNPSQYLFDVGLVNYLKP